MVSPELTLEFRPIGSNAETLLEHFTYLAIFLPEEVKAPPERIVYEEPLLRAFFEGFGGRAGDLGVVATSKGNAVGCAWLRIIPGGYGHVDMQTPELAIAVEPEWRGQGVGTRLLCELFEQAAAAGYRQLSLSVQKANPARHLYVRLGFELLRDNGEDDIMVKTL